MNTVNTSSAVTVGGAYAWRVTAADNQPVNNGGQTMEAYPARLEDEPVHFVADLGREAAFQELQTNKRHSYRGGKS